MSREALQSEIASAAYSIGFGAKTHFATMEMALKIPAWINFFTLVIGVYALIAPCLSAPFLAASLVVAGIASLYFSHYQDQQGAYGRAAKDLLKRYYDLQDLCARVEDAPEEKFDELRRELADIRRGAKDIAIYRQVFIAGWIAHLKFWGQAETAWIEKYRIPKITFLRDKIPLSFSIIIIILFVIILIMYLAGINIFTLPWSHLFNCARPHP